MRPETLAVHAGAEPDTATGAVAPPIHLSTTFAHGPAAERIAGYEYQREGNPTQDRLETALAALEGGAAGLAFASGMAAITAMLEALPNGARILIPDDCYTGLRLLAQDFLVRRGIVAAPVDMSDLGAVRAACVGGANHLCRAVLRLRTAGPQGPAACADRRQAHGQHDPGGRR